MPPPPTIAILAPGLLGASVAMAARARSAASRIHVWARRAETRLEVAGQPWCDQVHATPQEAVAEADLSILCVPVDQIAPLTQAVAPARRPKAIITDVGSVKAAVCRDAAHALGEAGRQFFIGSHPMAGSEKTGWTAAKAELFQDRTCFLTPLPEAAPESLDLLARFWSALGARVTTTTPDRHDEIVAAVSHLPHLLAAALGVTLSEGPADWRPFAGNGLRDSTRIAAGDPDLWLAILQANREEVLRALRRHQDTLQSLHALLANGDWPTLHANLKRAKLWRDGLV